MHLSEELLHPVDVLRPGGLGMPGGSQGGLLLLVILPSGLGEVVEEVGEEEAVEEARSYKADLSIPPHFFGSNVPPDDSRWVFCRSVLIML